MRETSTSAPQQAEAPASGLRGVLAIAVQGAAGPALDAARSLEERLRRGFPALEPAIFLTTVREGAVTLIPFTPDGAPDPSPALPHLAPGASQGAVPGRASPLGPLLREAVARDAAVVAIVAAEPHDESVDWLDQLLSPLVTGGFDFVCPAYRRQRTEGAINTGIVAPLMRTLYGKSVRQPLGTEVALSGPLARRLLAEEDWRRRPAEAGSDAWLIARVFGGEARVAQSWLGTWPRPPGEPEDVSETLARALGLVFGEMERSAAQWQKTGPSRPVATFGQGGFERGGGSLDAARLSQAFALGLRELHHIWSLILPPATLLALERASQHSEEGFPDKVWARVIFDFAVAHLTRIVERRQLLRSLAPLYLGWLAGLARDAASLDDQAFEARLEAIGAAFEREKRYLVARWRWPDEFNP